jgi:hypothetical protein
MTPVDQIVVDDPSKGDCQSACLASLLDLDISQVPNFLLDLPENQGIEFARRINRFLQPFGLMHLELEYRGFCERCKFYDVSDMFHMIYGPSPRDVNTLHAVVGRNGDIFHDPHPSRAGLLEPRSEWTLGFLVKIC